MNDCRLPDNLGTVEKAREAHLSGVGPELGAHTIFLLAGSVGLMMTGFGIIMPVFARRLGEFGDGVQELSLMTVAFAIA